MHATSFAYFAKTGDESAKKLLIDPKFQLLSSNAQEKAEGEEESSGQFHHHSIISFCTSWFTLNLLA